MVPSLHAGEGIVERGVVLSGCLAADALFSVFAVYDWRAGRRHAQGDRGGLIRVRYHGQRTIRFAADFVLADPCETGLSGRTETGFAKGTAADFLTVAETPGFHIAQREMPHGKIVHHKPGTGGWSLSGWAQSAPEDGELESMRMTALIPENSREVPPFRPVAIVAVVIARELP